jgi:poly-gamma-glutamate synthesis protein (capsule biosynthesis protein)
VTDWLRHCRLLTTLPALLLAASVCAATPGDDITLLFAGDVMLAETPGAAIQRGIDPFRDFSKLFADADLRIVNLQCSVSLKGRAEDKPFTFRAHPRVIPLLKKHVSAVSVANNHSGDFGKRAFVDMLDLLDRYGLPYFGGGRNIREAHRPFVTQVKGKTIAVLGFDGFMLRSFEALDSQPGVAWMDADLVAYQVRQAK